MDRRSGFGGLVQVYVAGFMWPGLCGRVYVAGRAPYIGWHTSSEHYMSSNVE